MPDQEFNVSPRDVPGRRNELLRDEERHIHAPGGSVVVTVPVVMPGHDHGRYPNPWNCPPDGQLPVPPPATLPLPDSTLFDMYQSSANFPFWRRVTGNIIDFIRQFWPAAYSWKSINARADTPTTNLFTVGSVDQVFELVFSVATKQSDAGASIGTLTLNFTGLDGTTSPATQTCDLSIVGNGGTNSFVVLLAAGSSVSFDFSGGGTYGTAAYDIIVSAIPKSSDKVDQPAGNPLR